MFNIITLTHVQALLVAVVFYVLIMELIVRGRNSRKIVGRIDPNEVVQELTMDYNDAKLRKKALESMNPKGINNSNNIMKADRDYQQVMDNIDSDMEDIVY